MATVDKIVSGIKAFWQIVDAITYGIYRELYHGKWIRRGMLGFSAYITFECFDVAWDLAMSSADNAAMVAAITTPASALLGSAIKFYNDNRRDEKRFSTEIARGQDDAE